MESAGIDDLIVNSTALSFLLNLDEIILATLRTESLKHLMHSCDTFELDPVEEPRRKSMFRRILDLAPTELVLVFVLTFLYILGYYINHCDYVDGRWVSKEMHLPST